MSAPEVMFWKTVVSKAFCLRCMVTTKIHLTQTAKFAHYCDVLPLLHENVRRLRFELWGQKNWLLHHDNATQPGNCLQKTT
jgi:hypothetical protein